jgi:hypothetical protein
MTTVIEILQFLLILPAGFLVTYQLLWSILALKAEKRENFKASKNRKFAVVLLANNDQEKISKSLYSLSGLVYPKNLYDLFVISEKKSGNIVNMARNLGATVFEVNGVGISKAKSSFSYILRNVINLDKSYEGLIIFDAKSFVSGDYLEVMNYYLEEGSKIIQGSSLFFPNPDKRGNKAACVDFMLNSYVKPLGKETLGIGLVPWNNGTCYSTDIIDGIEAKNGSPAKYIHPEQFFESEDLQTRFAPEAKIFIEEPIDNIISSQPSNSITFATTVFRGWKEISKKQKVRFVDSFFEYLTPSMANIITAVLVMGTVSSLLWFYGVTGALFIGLWSGIALLSIAHIFIALVAAEADKKVTTAISYWPSYLSAKLLNLLDLAFISKPEEKGKPPKFEKSKKTVSGF